MLENILIQYMLYMITIFVELPVVWWYNDTYTWQRNHGATRVRLCVARKHSLALVALNLSSLTQYPALYGPSISLSQGRPLIELSLLGVHASWQHDVRANVLFNMPTMPSGQPSAKRKGQLLQIVLQCKPLYKFFSSSSFFLKKNCTKKLQAEVWWFPNTHHAL